MRRYLIRKVFFLIFTVWAVLTIIFIGLHALPSNPAEILLAMQPDEQTKRLLEEIMGLNQPLGKQYLLYLKDILSGNLGKSLLTGQPIIDLYKQVFPHTLMLTFASLTVAIIIGIPLGIFTAVKQDTFWDYFGRFFAVIGLSVPSFFLGVLLLMFFSVKLSWFPVIGVGKLGDIPEMLYYLILPASSQGIHLSAFVMRISRSSFLDVFRQEYISVARSKGLSEFKVIFKHGLRNAMIPIVTVVGLYFNVAFGSSIIIEMVFNRPGIGRIIVEAILQRDYTLVQSSLIILSTFIIMVNTITDLTYTLIDPRISLSKKGR